MVWTGQFTLFYIDFDNQRQDISNDVGWTSLGATKHRGAELAFTYDLSDLYSQLDGAQRIYQLFTVETAFTGLRP